MLAEAPGRGFTRRLFEEESDTMFDLFGGLFGGQAWIWGILLVVLAWLCGCGGGDC